MNKEGNRFSPFELFYERFVDNLYEGIDYSEIIYNINKLKKVVYKFNAGVYDNINLYSNRLKRYYIRIKNILDNIQDKNESVFGEYYDLYLRHVDVFKEKEEDMVFVIANSFYNDNRIENLIKNNVNILKNEDSNKLKEYYSGYEIFDVFIKLLEESKYRKQYDNFINKVRDYKNYKPYVKEDKYEFFKRLESFISRIGSLSVKVQDKAVKNGDYLYINSVLTLLGIKDSFWGINIKYYLSNYYSVKYEEFSDSNELLKYVSLVNDISYDNYLNKTREYEKSTRVRTRVFSKAFKEFIQGSDAVVFCGHANADYDCFGAAIGLARAVKDCMKKAYIIYDESQAVAGLVNEMSGMPEYENVLISPENVAEVITPNTLLVILDTHRPSMLPDSSILDKTDKIVLIDHHRRSTEFLPHVSLLYHEPYASSTCEIATEILQYVDDNKMLSPFEAKALYVGMLIDTKNFVFKTGVRTFEAASYLRRFGLDTVDVKKLFTMNISDYNHKIKIMENIEMYGDGICIAYTDEKYQNMRVVSSIAADDMLGIRGV